ncbi:hypothetical protein JOC70_000763 [Clostridium pascui]|uniref:hypothetical protein n=1 Tax=Clostridium pascui TaxID=46609 RepID=UPI00195AF07D|nr:hypothetical protein [Clostridium pascui]MBM7869294.1 hypothetical protein [Clostridium pascui]
MKFNDFRVPVEYIVDQYWRKKNLKNNVFFNSAEEITSLPEYPVDIERNPDTKKVEKIIYDKDGILEWSEELLRDWNNKVTRIKVTLPDGEIKYIDLIRDTLGKVLRVEMN